MRNDLLTMTPTTESTPASPARLLIVDDEEQNRTLLHDPLEARGYEIEEAANGAEALLKVAMRPPDVILLDVMMPKIDGFDVCRRLKHDEKTACIPILMVTALSERKERLLGIEAGANDFLTKPVDLQEVALRVGNAVYAKRLFDQLQQEQRKSDELLLNIFPSSVAARMKAGEANIAESYPDVTVLCATLAGVDTLFAHIDPEPVVALLNEIFSGFDLLTEKHGLEKIKTVGGIYVVVGGMPEPRPDHAEQVAELALDLRESLHQFNRQNSTAMSIRIGICSGPVVAGVIGCKRFAYDLWGETINLAGQLASFAGPGEIWVAPAAYQRLKHCYHHERKQGGEIRVNAVAYELRDRIQCSRNAGSGGC